MAIINQILAARKLIQGQRKAPQDLTALDFDAAATRCVRLKVSGGEVLLLGAEILPALDLSDEDQVAAFELPKSLTARYVAMCIPGSDAVVKLLNLPGSIDNRAEDQIREHMGMDDGLYRFGYRVISQTRSEVRSLTVAIPETQIMSAISVFPAGLPAPVSVELSGLAVMSAFLNGPGKTLQDEAIGVIDWGSRITYFAFFKKRELILIRKFDFGHVSLLDRIEKSMGVDRQTAQNIVVDRSFDISQMVKDLADPFIKQLLISKHFVERRENCRISRIFVPDDPFISRDWLNEIKGAMGVDTSLWNPFDSVKVLPDALPSKYKAMQSQFAAAIGAGLAVFEEGGAGSRR